MEKYEYDAHLTLSSQKPIVTFNADEPRRISARRIVALTQAEIQDTYNRFW